MQSSKKEFTDQHSQNPSAPGVVLNQLTDLEMIVESLESFQSTMVKRLQPIMTPKLENGGPEDGPGVMSACCEVAGRIRGAKLRLEQLRDNFDYMMEHIEL